MSATCAVCATRVRVSNGRLIKHRDAHHHVCDNSGCDAEANARAGGKRPMCNDGDCPEWEFPHDEHGRNMTAPTKRPTEPQGNGSTGDPA